MHSPVQRHTPYMLKHLLDKTFGDHRFLSFENFYFCGLAFDLLDGSNGFLCLWIKAIREL